MTDETIPFEWTTERIAMLADLWDEGLTTREIGGRLGITKNAVVGKAHRLSLPRRVASAAPPPQETADILRLESLTFGMCSWPTGEPRADDFHFCGEKVVQDKPYCAEHCAKAYVKNTKEAKLKQSAAA